ncbi:MAG: UDP-N-acetylglucosamine 1-carboxyvinyltransferase [Victivallaceae bacterium]
MSKKTPTNFLKITGGTRLKGRVKVSGAKNSATKLLIASLLSDKRCVIRNVPDIGDVRITVELCKEIGAHVLWDKEAEVIEITASEIKRTCISCRFSNVNRIPVLLLGALLARSEEQIKVPAVGGDAIGKRTLNFHIDALRQLGAEISYLAEEDVYIARRKGQLTGTIINLPYSSVGATENIIFTAVRAKGKTIIHNAAVEPEIIDLIMFFQKMGVLITVENDRSIEITGVDSFHEVDHSVIPDRIEAASFGLAAVLTEGRVFVEGAQHVHLLPLLNNLRKIGGEFIINPEGIDFFYDKPLKGGLILETDVYPSFTTDWQQPFAVLLTQAGGESIIHETVHENRLGYLKALQTMGANCRLVKRCLGSKPCRYHDCNFAHSAVIRGATPLKAAHLKIPDLRAGFSYIMAAMVAEGESVILGLDLIERGYKDLVNKLACLGAEIAVSQEESSYSFV